MTRETFNRLILWGLILGAIIFSRFYFLKSENRNLKQENLLLKNGDNRPSPK